MTHLFIDLESRSALDVTKVGAFAYARHPSTQILCMAFGYTGAVVDVVTERQSPPPVGTVLVAHNVDFEREMLQAVWGWPVWKYEWLDTAALSAGLGLPRNLEDLAAFFGYEKDMAGNKVMKKLCRPRADGTFWEPHQKPDDFAKLYAYCRTDVEVMRDIHARLQPLSEQEQAVWLLTDRMNQRGLALDLPAVHKARTLVRAAEGKLGLEFRTLTGCAPKSYPKVAAWAGLPDVRKATVRKALRDPLVPSEKKEGLRLYQTLARSSTAKLDAMLKRVSGDGRLRGAFVYGGAERTLRWSSWGVQLQNFPRGFGAKQELAFRLLDAGLLDLSFDDIVGTVAEMLRGFILGPLIVGDYAQIEARVLVWLAGQKEMLKVFSEHGDPYSVMASKVYGRTITKESTDDSLPSGVTPRFMGKQLVLGAGYGLGHKGFRRLLDETYDVDIEEEEAKRLIKIFRRSNPEVVNLWGVLERGWRYATSNKSKLIQVGPVQMGTTTVGDIPYTFIVLPSGRRLWYADARVKPNGDLRYFGRDLKRGGSWQMVGTYGGKLAENVTQAVARDIMALGMLRLEEHGWPMLGTVHDEAISRPKGGADEEQEFQRVMCELPSWAAGLPVEAEVFTSDRYRK